VNPKVSVGIVLFGEQYLAESLPSLVKQDYENVEFLLLDQEDGVWSASKFVEQNLTELKQDPRVKLERGKNLFHSGGQNKLIQKALERGADYYICASSDMLYPTDLVKKAVETLERDENQKYGTLGVKLLRWKEDVIDSCGIGASKAHRFFEIGGGKKDGEKFAKAQEIFGASCALAVFRRKVLEEVAVERRVFDERLHYKNDVDLAYRLQWLGWKALYTPEITCQHARALGAAKNRQERSNFEKENSTFGQLVVIEKNFSDEFSFGVKLLTKLRLLALRIFGIFFGKAERNAFRKFEQIRGKLVKSKKKVSAQEVEKNF